LPKRLRGTAFALSERSCTIARKIHDHFFKRAKAEGYRSRAVFKLTEIDDRRKLLRPGMRVLDAGCAPGSWLQVIAERVGKSGVVVGVDLKEVDERGLPPNVRLVQGDLTALTRAELLGALDERWPEGPPFDAILSDMAPDTTGDPFGDSHRSIRLCNLLLDRCADWLRTGGALVVKAFEGEAYPELLQRMRGEFESARGFKPKASRGDSVEMFVIGQGYRRAATADDAESGLAPPKPKPRTGW